MLPRFVLFLLRPFAKPLRYGLLKLMKRRRLPRDHRPVIAASEHLLNEFMLPSVWKLFRDQKFRTVAGFRALPVAEHDRIWNELIVANISMIVLTLDAASSAVPPEDLHFWQEVQGHIPKQFQRELVRVGVSGENAKTMRQLIAMRDAEYADLARALKKTGEFRDEMSHDFPNEMRDFVADIHSVSICTANHITRGKLKAGDPLIRVLRWWLLNLHGRVSTFVVRL